MTQIKLYPSISVIVPAHNEASNLERLIPSLLRTSYPKNKIEFIIVNDDSTDATEDVIKKFKNKVKLINTKVHDAEIAKWVGLMASKNQMVYFPDSDMEICSSDFFQLMTKPLVENKNIIASFADEFTLDEKYGKVKSSILRFISYHPLQQDPLYQVFSPTIVSTIIDKTDNYYICNFIPGKIPAVGRILYRKKEMLHTDIGKAGIFIDMEVVETVARAGHQIFAYVPKAKIRHYHAETLRVLIKKRLRNLNKNYLPNLGHKYYLWFNPNNKMDTIKICVWILWANLFVPETIRGIINTIRYKDIAFMWHPIVAITTTDTILWGFFTRKAGRKLIVIMIKNLIKIR